jgi:transaldolase
MLLRTVSGWVSLDVSPVLAHDTQRTIAAARDLSQRGGRSNLFIKIPGTKRDWPRSLPEFSSMSRFIFSREQYLAAAGAYLRGVERRIEAGPQSGPRFGRIALLTSPRFLRTANGGARPQRLLCASTGAKDSKASDAGARGALYGQYHARRHAPFA